MVEFCEYLAYLRSYIIYYIYIKWWNTFCSKLLYDSSMSSHWAVTGFKLEASCNNYNYGHGSFAQLKFNTLSILPSILPSHVSGLCNNFDIVCLSVSMCICLALPGERTDIRTSIMVWRWSRGKSGSGFKARDKVQGHKIKKMLIWIKESDS